MSRGQSLRDISRVDLGGRSLREVGRLGEVARRRDGTKADPESGASSLSPPPARILILLDEESSTWRAPATFAFLRFVTCLFLFWFYPRDKNTEARPLSGATAALEERDLNPWQPQLSTKLHASLLCCSRHFFHLNSCCLVSWCTSGEPRPGFVTWSDWVAPVAGALVYIPAAGWRYIVYTGCWLAL